MADDPYDARYARLAGHRAIATTIGQWVISMLLIIFWGILAIAALAVAYVAIRAVWWAVNLTTAALGLEFVP